MMSNKTVLQDKSFEFSTRLLRFAGSIELTMATKVIVGQLVRSGTSIGANIAEAQGSSSRREYTNYFHIALKSAGETSYWLKLLLYELSQKKEEIERLLSSCQELAKMLTSAIMTLKGKK